MVHINKLKVRPKKCELSLYLPNSIIGCSISTGQPKTLCAYQMSKMLGCWAATKDLSSINECAEAAAVLHDCMRNTPMQHKRHASTINYHLSRLQKVLNK
ncbi:hypothetical protein BD410DRAFT_714224 [Rickenella mellea]|uniref:37S ribosomal protein mrp10, mitochondrial n=1 Tax=Rickenella mellea TaxID=50990 RepID=A0A4Y7QL27_9AGAM|nr:hypothetical protein BD410DRAFT_714224 [Rickenella mellea]